MRNAALIAALAIILVPPIARGANPGPVEVAAGESIQKAIDAAANGAVIHVAAGVFPEHLTITKPLTLEGAGWDKTVIKPAAVHDQTQAEKDAFFKKLDATRDLGERRRLAMEIANISQPPTIAISATDGAVITNLRVQGEKIECDGRVLGSDPLIRFQSSRVAMKDVAVVGPYMDGVHVFDGSDVEMSHCLIAAMWGTGVAVSPGERAAKDAKLHIVDCDVRNCYSRCLTVGCDAVTIERCNISGSAWHGIRYDNCSPTILNNHIFANARCGIYASGKTSAIVRGNIFSKNEMSGMSCWFDNADKIEKNTFAENLREGLGVLGASKPSVTNNIFLENPVAVQIGKIGGNEKSWPADPKFDGNTFWKNKTTVRILDKDDVMPAGSKLADPGLKDASAEPKSDWSIQTEETAIIPASRTRDYSKWKTARGMS